MTTEFVRVRATFASSILGRLLAWLAQSVAAAWRTSAFHSTTRRLQGHWRTTPASVIRATAISVAIAAAMQPLLIRMMPETVKPAMPTSVFVIVAVLAAALALLAPHRPTANIR